MLEAFLLLLNKILTCVISSINAKVPNSMLLLSFKVTLQQWRKVKIVILLPNVEVYLLQTEQLNGVK